MSTTNISFKLTSVLLITVGTTIQSIYGDFSQFLDNHFMSIPSLLVAVGAIMLIVATFGVIGAFKESTMLTNIVSQIHQNKWPQITKTILISLLVRLSIVTRVHIGNFGSHSWIHTTESGPRNVNAYNEWINSCIHEIRNSHRCCRFHATFGRSNATSSIILFLMLNIQQFPTAWMLRCRWTEWLGWYLTRDG